MKISLLPVYSKLVELDETQEELRARLPEGWQLSQHQIETYEALTSEGYDIVFNTAMTGDGKSLAAYLRSLLDGDHVIAMYPTNELIRDQKTRIDEYKAEWKSQASSDVMFGARITELMEISDTSSRVEQIRKLLEHNDILLTNPDLFHLMMNFKIGHQDWERKELPFEVPANYDYFIFDEFHIFGVPQVISVVNAINYLAVQYHYKPTEHKRFLFLSATPHPLMSRLLARSGLRVIEVEGSYRSDPDPDYRPILQGCTLQFESVDTNRTVEAWVRENLEEIIRFFEMYPGSKGAIIVNSAAVARRLKIWLEIHLPSSISVGENTGLTGWDERRASFEKHLLVGTSTVDIGIDFRINLLIFEATDAGNFIQRFGRLGRHAGFPAYQAYALLPKFITERFSLNWADGAVLERTAFNASVGDVYPNEQQFVHYASRWGIWQTAHLLAQTERSLPKETRFTSDLVGQFNKIYDPSSGKRFERLIPQYWAKVKREDECAVLDELTSFRGHSPLSCGLWDLTDEQLKTYDLFFLLANTQFEVIEEDKFMAEVRRRGLPAAEFKHQLLFVKVYRYIEEREDYVLGIKRDLNDHAEWLHNVQAFKGFYVKESRQPWIDAVNRALRSVRLVCVISDQNARELKRQLWLPIMFPVYRLMDLYDSEFSVAFGQNALLLESLIFFKNNRDRAIIV